MKPKTIITAALAIFVAASAAYLIFGGDRRAAETAAAPDTGAVAAAEEARPMDESKKTGMKTVVYYFHTTYRCHSCQKIEELTARSVRDVFSQELAECSVAWKPVNIDLPENRHFIDDFQLFTKSVVVVNVEGGKRVRWKNLARIWELLRDESGFTNYIRTEVEGFRHGS
ncbi:MAG: hypothetical protein JW838_03940 [Spirochaetes bacterium]|nr:hypothetical protein [Spirochaetota bacterium]